MRRTRRCPTSPARGFIHPTRSYLPPFFLFFFLFLLSVFSCPTYRAFDEKGRFRTCRPRHTPTQNTLKPSDSRCFGVSAGAGAGAPRGKSASAYRGVPPITTTSAGATIWGERGAEKMEFVLSCHGIVPHIRMYLIFCFSWPCAVRCSGGRIDVFSQRKCRVTKGMAEKVR